MNDEREMRGDVGVHRVNRLRIGLDCRRQRLGGRGPRERLSSSDGFVGDGIVMLAVCMLGCVVPTRRALTIEPTIALRTE